jgi:hypothetical protein
LNKKVTVEDCSIERALFFVEIDKLVPATVGGLFLDEFLGEEGLVELGLEGEVAGNVEG